MPVAKGLRAIWGGAAILTALAFTAGGAFGTKSPLAAGLWDSPVPVHFDSASQVTRIAERIAPDLCFSLHLPQEWRSKAEGAGISLEAVSFSARLEISLRSAQELRDMPQPDLASRDAAVLQRDYEHLLGRPAQSVSLDRSPYGATRWSATWIDANLPSASRSLTVETFILPLSSEWILELSLTHVEMPEVHDALIRRILSGLKIMTRKAC